MSVRTNTRKSYHSTAPLENAPLHTLSYAAGRVIPAGVGVIMIPMVARALGPAGYGAYCVLAAEVLLVAALLGSWADLGTVRFYAQIFRDGRANEYMRAVVRGLLLCYGVFALIATGVTISTGYAITQPLVVAGVAGVATLVNLRGTCFRALHAGRDFSVLLSASSIFRLGLTAAVLVAWASPVGVAVAWMLSGLLALCLVHASWPRSSTAHRGDYDLAPLLRYAAPLTLVGAGAVGLFLADRLIIAEMLGERAVGVYSLSYMIADQTIVIVSSIMLLPVFPRAVDIFDARGHEAAGATIISALRRWSLVVFPLAAIVGVASREIVLAVGGTEYLAPVILIPLVLAGSLAYALGQFLSISLQLMGRTVLYGGVVCVSLALNIAANVWWISWWGISGAAAATFVAYAVFAITSAFLSRRVVPVRLVGAAVSPALCASAVPVVICSFTPNLVVRAACVAALAAMAMAALARERPRRVVVPPRIGAR
jgi:O-antigen/teichoic acid export membrane protein